MDEGVREQIDEWFDRARGDLEAAALIIRGRGPSSAAAAHIQQGIEKYLKGLLVAHDVVPRKIHDLVPLLSEAVRYLPDLAGYESLCDRATDYYLMDRYPPGPSPAYPWEQLESDLRETETLARQIMQHVEGL